MGQVKQRLASQPHWGQVRLRRWDDLHAKQDAQTIFSVLCCEVHLERAQPPQALAKTAPDTHPRTGSPKLPMAFSTDWHTHLCHQKARKIARLADWPSTFTPTTSQNCQTGQKSVSKVLKSVVYSIAKVFCQPNRPLG